MDNKNKEEVIEEDIQIEEDECEDDKKNIKTNTKIEESENTEEDDLMYEDEYESVKDDILKSMSLLSSHKESLSIKNMKQKNKNKLNKLSLLLSQKFLNIIFSILSCHLKKIYKIFFNNIKSLIIYKFNMINLSNKKHPKNLLKKEKIKPKINTNIITNRVKSAKINNNYINNKLYKVPKYYIESQRKQEERKIKKEMIKKHFEENKKKKINEEKKKEKELKTNTEIEYERYQYQKKLEKYNEQERKKYLDDLIRKNTYADNIYKFIKKKQFFANLKFNLEIRKVVFIFLSNINNKMTKINGLKTIKKVSEFLKEKREKKELLDNFNADKLYKKNLMKNFILYLKKYNKNEKEKDNNIKNKLILFKKRIVFNNLRKAFNYEYLETKDKKDIIIKNHLFYIKKKMFYILMYFVKEKRDEKIKEDLISKLKNKANELLKNYE